MIAGEYYLAGDPVLVKDRRRSKNLPRLNITEYRITKKSKRNNKRTDSECRSKSLY
jgi:maltose O-acetyltransferase